MVDREKAAGDFSIDLVDEDGGGGTVIIENQLEKSNHDHLGKIITYLTGMSARAAIWIVSDPRPEHVAAITWLNEASSAAFYMVKVEAVRIGESPATPLFTLIVGPSEETKEVGETKQKIAERYVIRKRWWTQLLERAAKVSKLHSHITPREYSYLVWRPTACAPVSRPLHPSRGHLQPSLAVLCRWPSYLSLARFGPQQRTEVPASICR